MVTGEEIKVFQALRLFSRPLGLGVKGLALLSAQGTVFGGPAGALAGAGVRTSSTLWWVSAQCPHLMFGISDPLGLVGDTVSLPDDAPGV